MTSSGDRFLDSATMRLPAGLSGFYPVRSARAIGRAASRTPRTHLEHAVAGPAVPPHVMDRQTKPQAVESPKKPLFEAVLGAALLPQDLADAEVMIMPSTPEEQLQEFIAAHGLKKVVTVQDKPTPDVVGQTPEQKRQALVQEIGDRVSGELTGPGAQVMTEQLLIKTAAQRGAQLAIETINQQQD